MNIHFNIDASEIDEYAEKLGTLHRSAIPIAIRGTLNDLAFAMKKEMVPKIARQTFKERQPNFFKANSRAEQAKGFDVKNMVATFGFVSSGLHSPATNYAVKDLEQQEFGGIIKGRSFKPLPDARIGVDGNVRSNLRIAKLREGGNIVDTRDSNAKNKMQSFIKSSVHAGVGGLVLNGRGSGHGGGVLWAVTKIKRIGRNIRFEKRKLYSFKKSGVAKVHATGFVKKSALQVQKEMESFFVAQATKQFKKAGVMA